MLSIMLTAATVAVEHIYSLTLYYIHRYEHNKEMPFHFKSNALLYGRDDVAVLARACLAFRKEIIEVAGLDPWLNSFTLASLCATIFRCQMLEEDTIGLVPSNGYNKGTKFQSLAALKYLHWLASKRQIRIQTSVDTGG